jgi:hypothetical protein
MKQSTKTQYKSYAKPRKIRETAVAEISQVIAGANLRGRTRNSDVICCHVYE